MSLPVKTKNQPLLCNASYTKYYTFCKTQSHDIAVIDLLIKLKGLTQGSIIYPQCWIYVRYLCLSSDFQNQFFTGRRLSSPCLLQIRILNCNILRALYTSFISTIMYTKLSLINTSNHRLISNLMLIAKLTKKFCFLFKKYCLYRMTLCVVVDLCVTFTVLFLSVYNVTINILYEVQTIG